MTAHLVCLDIDGTTIDHAGVLHDPVREAVAAVAAAGHHVTIATGRAVVATMPIIRALGLTQGYAVCSNGAVTVRLTPVSPEAPDGYVVEEAVTFDPRPVLGRVREHLPEGLVGVEELGRGFRISARWPEGELEGDLTVVEWEDLLSRPVTRIVIRDPHSTPEDFLDTIERVGLHGVSYAVGYTAWLDIAPEGVSKASALELVRRHLHVEPEHTLAVGDQRNDLEMLRWAARGVAMGNAPDEVKEAADEVTGTVDDHGLADVLAPLALTPAGPPSA